MSRGASGLSASVAAQRVLTFLLCVFFLGAGSEDRCKIESTLYGLEDPRTVVSEGAMLG